MRFLLLFLMGLFSSTAFAEKLCPQQIYTNAKAEPDYECPSPGEAAMTPKLQLTASVALKFQDKAPWDGILMQKERVLVLGLTIEGLRRLRWIDITSAEERLQLETEYLKKNHSTELSFTRQQRDNWKKVSEDALKDLASYQKWYRSNTFWFMTGVVVTAAAATALAYGLRK